MTSKTGQKKPEIPRVDLPEISETFADSLGGVMAGEGVFRIELLVKRAQIISDNSPPRMKKFTAARIVLTNEGAVELCNTLNNLLSAMQGPPMKPDIKLN